MYIKQVRPARSSYPSRARKDRFWRRGCRFATRGLWPLTSPLSAEWTRAGPGRWGRGGAPPRSAGAADNWGDPPQHGPLCRALVWGRQDLREVWRGWAFPGGPEAGEPVVWAEGPQLAGGGAGGRAEGKLRCPAGRTPRGPFGWAVWRNASPVRGCPGGTGWVRWQLNPGAFSSPTHRRSEKDSACTMCSASISCLLLSKWSSRARVHHKDEPIHALGRCLFWICWTLSTPFLERVLFFGWLVCLLESGKLGSVRLLDTFNTVKFRLPANLTQCTWFWHSLGGLLIITPGGGKKKPTVAVVIDKELFLEDF